MTCCVYLAKGVLGGCEFEGVEDTAHCGVCDTDVEVSGLEQHLSYHHSSEEIKVNGRYYTVIVGGAVLILGQFSGGGGGGGGGSGGGSGST